MSIEGLVKLLGDFSSAGEFDSQGVFTISRKKAVNKLSAFRLRDPKLYVLNLLSVAVLQGASFFEIRHLESCDEVTFDGRLFSRAELEDLIFPESPPLEELAVALSAARSVGYSSIHFRSGGSLEWSKDGLVTSARGGQVNELRLERPLGPQLVGQDGKLCSSSSAKALSRSAQFARLEIRADGRTLATPKVLSVLGHCLEINQPEIDTKALGEVRCTTQRRKGSYRAIVGAQCEGWHFVFRGVSYTRTAKALGTGRLTGVVYSDEFTKDVSHTELVKTHRFQAILDDLKQAIEEEILGRLCSRPLGEEDMTQWASYARAFSERLFQAGREIEASRVLAWCLACERREESSVPSRRMAIQQFSDPALFLLQYLHVARSQKLEEQIVGFLPAKGFAYREVRRRWNSHSLLTLCLALLDYFPKQLSWRAIRPLVQLLSEREPVAPIELQSFWAKLRSKVRTDEIKVDDFELADFLCRSGQFDFLSWAKAGLENASIGQRGRNWLQGSPYAQELDAYFRNHIENEKVLSKSYETSGLFG